ncbi:MAG: hypothetical protein HY692_03955 [Cyanobacteria bacterium NC_groundwater_1444_Ag_S-0.65um_54_12]|nr:hypothetical protein [Cyanobacteria bacterium NC_groundwater_1444_Ag_S-0.65um_54_12]
MAFQKGGPAVENAARQSHAPLLSALRIAASRTVWRLHTPVHQGFPDPEFAALMGTATSLDLTELEETDDLRDPKGAIAEAETLAAEHFGAERTWFLVAGASVGNMAALLAISAFSAAGRSASPPRVIVDRNAHVSVVAGLVLAELEPIWVSTPWLPRWCITGPPAPEAFAAALSAHPEAVAVIITAPTYYGTAADIAALRNICGERLLIVDEAHGSHLPRALPAGADIVIHSAHKGLLGPTQGGFLHLRSGQRFDSAYLTQSLRLLQTTSPNYWLLAGLDAARRAAAKLQLTSPTLPSSALATISGPALEIYANDDPTRLLVYFPDGFAAYEALAKLSVQAEAALPTGVLFFLGRYLADTAALASLADVMMVVRQSQATQPARSIPSPPPMPEAVLLPRAATLSRAEPCAIELAVDRICAEVVCPYPPGIPLLVPGERIGSRAIEHLGAVIPELRTVRVIMD